MDSVCHSLDFGGGKRNCLSCLSKFTFRTQIMIWPASMGELRLFIGRGSSVYPSTSHRSRLLGFSVRKSCLHNGQFYPREEVLGHPMLRRIDIELRGETHQLDSWTLRDSCPCMYILESFPSTFVPLVISDHVPRANGEIQLPRHVAAQLKIEYLG